MSDGTAPARTPIGDTGVAIPSICFGTSALGDMPNTYGYEVDAARAHATVNAIFDGPTKFLDTSRNYGMGRSEERVGDVIRDRGGLPEGVVISTKLDRDMDTNRLDASRARRSLEESLSALNLDRVHILHLHDPEYLTSLEDVTGSDGALAELFRMKEEGLAQAVGLAAGNVDVMMPIIREWPFDCMITHSRFTLTNANAEPMIDLARSRDVTVFNAAPFAGGVLAKGTVEMPRYVYQEASDETLAPVRKIEGICARHGVPTAAAALQWSMRDPRIGTTICGVSKPERVEQTLALAALDLPEALWDELNVLPRATNDPEATRTYDPG